MDDLDELEGVLADAGFSGYEAEAYLGLLQLRDASVAELASVCSVPRSRLYDVLRDLEDEGYVETYERESLRGRIANVSAAAEELRDRATELEDGADRLEAVWERPRFEQTDISVFQTHAATVREATARIDAAEHTVHLCVTPDELLELADPLRDAIDRDVVIRIAVQTGETGADTDLPHLFPDVAFEVRQCEAAAHFIALVDGSFAALAVDNEWDGQYGLVVDDNTLGSILHWYYQIQLWEPWDTLYSASMGTPTTFVSIRELIREIESVRTDDETVTVRVEGVDTESREAVEIEGEVVDVIYTDIYEDRDVTFAQQFIQAALRVRSGDEEYTIGGYGAVLEDIRAIQMTITDIK
ncbi:TrmB family transcriptional regulator [Halosimplex halophilum]|uniref:TrmB family transcriptional regulator n=1 Tax=Halosimplex halophilum TaxID=2559572 RepID=UPI00107FA2C8|nr:TrmB family transcriptional regulator sugar-binding domain-containing protein [Halosimplex halophilum]